MILITGGRSQGKLEYALTNYNIPKQDICDGGLEPKPVVYNLQTYIKNRLAQGINPEEEILSFAAAHPDTIFICDLLGCGIVPMEKADRLWRDTTGRICCLLARDAEKVVRVIAGIGQVIKQ